jgi:hypothetical protein
MRIRLIAGVLMSIAAVSLIGASATRSSAASICGSECPTSYTPYPFGTWDLPSFIDGGGTPNDIVDDTLVFTGWAIDWDAPRDPDGGASDPIDVRVDVYRWSTATSPESLVLDRSMLVLADQLRPGLPTSLTKYTGQYHGFRVEIPFWDFTRPLSTGYFGRACFTALNVGPGTDRPLLRYVGTTLTNCYSLDWLT